MRKEILRIGPESSIEYFLDKNNVKSQIIFILVLITLLVVFILLPCIKVTLSIQGRGIIRPICEKTNITSIHTELVTFVYIREGQFVNKGDTLIVLRQDIICDKVQFIQNELTKTQQYIKDLDILTRRKNIPLVSDLYILQNVFFKRKIFEVDSRLNKARKEEQRNKSLYNKKLISPKEYEDLVFRLIQIENEKGILESNQMKQWEADLIKYCSEEKNLQKQLDQMDKEKQYYTIVSPVSGTVEEFSGIYVGSILQAGQTIAVISPESAKIAEVYISAKDIGYLIEGQSVKIQIEAFNYNQWGFIEGYIIDISDDFFLVDKTPVFLVKCRLTKDFLELRNGIKGKIKKGMTVNARFIMDKRSIFQLLYQKSDNWLNPSRNLTSKKN